MRKFISFLVAIGIIFTIASCGSIVESLEVKQARLEESLQYSKNGFQFYLTAFGNSFCYAYIGSGPVYEVLENLDDRLEYTNKVLWENSKYDDKIVIFASLKEECNEQDLSDIMNKFNQLPELIEKNSITYLYPYSDSKVEAIIKPNKLGEIFSEYKNLHNNIESVKYQEGYTSNLSGYHEPSVIFTLKEKSHENVQNLARTLILREDLFYNVKTCSIPEFYNPYASSTEEYTPEYNADISKQTYLNDAQIIDAWSNTPNLTTVKVGVVDSGIDYTHEDLAGRVNTTLSKSFNGNETSPLVDTFGHGTFVSGIIAANPNNSIGISGVAPNVELVSLKVNDYDGGAILDSMAQAIEYATEQNIPILNISMGVRKNSNDYNQTQLDNLKDAVSNYPGLIVCAAGNDALDIDLEDNYTYPACLDYDNIIVIGALNGSSRWQKNDNNPLKIKGTNFGNENVDLFAQGTNILSTISTSISSTDRYGYSDGTSFAAPIVTGVAAMLKGKDYSLSSSEIKNSLMNNVTTINNFHILCVTSGKINAISTLTHPQLHSFTYTFQANEHTKYCDCGYAYTEPHQLTYSYTSTKHTSNCDCGYTNIISHTYNQYTYQDTTYHQTACVCGKQGSLQKHNWVRSMTGNLDYNPTSTPYYIPFYECRQCGAICMDPNTGI